MYRLAIAAVLTMIALPAAAVETRASAAAKFKTEFAASDTNRDGVLTRAEVQARIGRMNVGPNRPDAVHAKRLADLWFDRADANRDGKVTQYEAQRLLAATFDKYDADHDGRIGTGERDSARKALAR